MSGKTLRAGLTIQPADKRALENRAKLQAEAAASSPSAPAPSVPVPADGGSAWLGLNARVGASLRQLKAGDGFRFSQVDKPAGHDQPLVLLPEHSKAEFASWYSGHDAFHPFAQGFASVAAEVIPIFRTEVARCLLRCQWDAPSQTIVYDRAKGAMSEEDAELAAQTAAEAIAALQSQAPDNTIYYLLAKPAIRERLRTPESLLGFELSELFRELNRTPGSLAKLTPAQENRIADMVRDGNHAVSFDSPRLMATSVTPEGLRLALLDRAAGVRSPLLEEVVDLFQKAGWTFDLDDLLTRAAHETTGLNALLNHPDSVTVEGVWLLPGHRDQPLRAELLDSVLAQLNSVDPVMNQGGSIEWVQLPAKRE